MCLSKQQRWGLYAAAEWYSFCNYCHTDSPLHSLSLRVQGGERGGDIWSSVALFSVGVRGRIGTVCREKDGGDLLTSMICLKADIIFLFSVEANL